MRYSDENRRDEMELDFHITSEGMPQLESFILHACIQVYVHLYTLKCDVFFFRHKFFIFIFIFLLIFFLLLNFSFFIFCQLKLSAGRNNVVGMCTHPYIRIYVLTYIGCCISGSIFNALKFTYCSPISISV